MNTIIGRRIKKNIFDELSKVCCSIACIYVINPTNIPIKMATDASLNKFTCLCSQYVYKIATPPSIDVENKTIPPVIRVSGSKLPNFTKGLESIMMR